jgi:hypothetical protein
VVPARLESLTRQNCRSASSQVTDFGTMLRRRPPLYLRGPDGLAIKGKRVHWYSFMLRYPDSRIVRFLRTIPTVRVSLRRPDDTSFDPPEPTA